MTKSPSKNSDATYQHPPLLAARVRESTGEERVGVLRVDCSGCSPSEVDWVDMRFSDSEMGDAFCAEEEACKSFAGMPGEGWSISEDEA